jgi:tRNA A-37 threonylcarbamoyl transferase component Bud32
VHRLEFAVAGETRALFVKLPRESGPNREMYARRLRRESEITQRIKAQFVETGELRIVTPAAYIDEVDGLATWEVPGDCLLDLISNNLPLRFGRTAPRLAYLCELAGRWLGHFHRIGYVADRSALRSSLTRYYEVRIDELVDNATSRVSRSLAETLLRRISNWLDQTLDQRSHVVLCHYDFSAHNIIVTRTGLCVLDFSFAGAGLPAFDVACFWHKLDDLKISRIRSSRNIEMLQQRFIAGYGRDIDWGQPEARLGLARLVLSQMCSLLREKSLRPDVWIDGKRRYARYLACLESGLEPADHS